MHLLRFPSLGLGGFLAMIDYVLIFNRQGTLRASKWYNNQPEHTRAKLVSEIHRNVSTREPRASYSNFVDFHEKKLVYRRYAGLYFAMLVQPTDNLLVHLVAIHLFVEALDVVFPNVCELDLVFNFCRVILLIDEIFGGGEVVEMSHHVIGQRMKALETEKKDKGANRKIKTQKKQSKNAAKGKVVKQKKSK
eukprot:TRINITY_DN11018_c0_g1_i2.p1 TRINITY_DN11018_c0_g1~~TRINITY_DN11018_c0_g1_i2.p1  ORF type:complete len:192 (-),score=39.46 TRINITY_DN11018_c0_g1_i2:210-785(-)